MIRRRFQRGARATTVVSAIRPNAIRKAFTPRSESSVRGRDKEGPGSSGVCAGARRLRCVPGAVPPAAYPFVRAAGGGDPQAGTTQPWGLA